MESEAKLGDKEILKLMTQIFSKILILMEDLYVEDYLKDGSEHLRTQINNALASAENLEKEIERAEKERLTQSHEISDLLDEDDGDLSKLKVFRGPNKSFLGYQNQLPSSKSKRKRKMNGI